MASDSLIGRTIGVYEVLSKIGQGGMAEVYQGFHPALRRYVAIKLMGRSLQTDDKVSQRFQREAQAIASLRHPNVVQVFDFGAFEGGHYLVMEYVEGTDLRGEIDHRHEEGRSFSPNEILDILEQVASGLDYAHWRGIVHRDVKPGNILLTTDGQAILTDFGLAMLRDRVSQVSIGHTFGTPAYIAPEQAMDSRTAVPQSDIYSLGGLLYEITTGRLPFDAESPISLALKHISEEPTPPRQHAPHLPQAVEAVILRALAKDPVDRFPTAQEMVDALRQAWAQDEVESEETVLSLASLPGGPPPPPPPPVDQPSPISQPVEEPVLTEVISSRSQPPSRGHLSGDETLSQDEPPPTEKRRNWLLWAGLPILFLIILIAFLAGKQRGVPVAVASVTPSPTSPAPIATKPPTPTETQPPTPTLSPTSEVTATTAATVLSSSPVPSPTNTPTPTPTETPTPTPSPTPTPLPTDTPTPTLTPTLAPGEATTRPVDGMTMHFVPGGPFLMGAADDTDAFSREEPQHEVILSPFWMDETEVSNDQYRRCVDAGICTEPANYATNDVTPYDDPAQGDYPVIYITWTQADAYCGWLADETGWNISLPSEAQWEKTASWIPGDDLKRRYPWGDEEPDSARLNYLGSGRGRPVAVGSYPTGASPYGVLDMAGNVWEWVGDWYASDYYDTPNLPADPTGPAQGTNKIMRGGSCGYGARYVRATHREVAGDFEKAKGDALGFRCTVNQEQLP
ncbi:MAG: SUMF1/EgtB/PvdO family nonheme iron enzyme [Chloroflexi bacterium]|nr:SUMF1/EgtB/PvdO family nonheme iron enzyme [Chloroflexota bacterium]